MPLPAQALLIDLRPQELRFREPLEALTPLPVRPLTLEAIERGTHGLTPDLGPLVVVCERGPRSALAARLLQADGLDAAAYPGGLPGLRRELGR